LPDASLPVTGGSAQQSHSMMRQVFENIPQYSQPPPQDG